MDKKENIKKILEKIQEAEYVLVGLGLYFDMQDFLSMQEGYREIIDKLQESLALWMEPYVDTCCRKQFAPIAPYGKFPGKNFSLKRSAM